MKAHLLETLDYMKAGFRNISINALLKEVEWDDMLDMLDMLDMIDMLDMLVMLVGMLGMFDMRVDMLDMRDMLVFICLCWLICV